MTERQEFVRLVLMGQVTMTQACEQFGISMKTGYRILARYAELGMTGLADAARAPKTHPNLPTRPLPRSKPRCCACERRTRRGVGRRSCGRSIASGPTRTGRRGARWMRS
ncbi:MAG: helix-turn-helix domain-containing protein [Planctomycetes bacterium]|nr:helix-turn-helix domain-containing protein [Planctomycetota bacterium]